MKEKSKFQKELERTASRKIGITVIIGCFFFYLAFIMIYTMTQTISQQKYTNMVANTYRQVYECTEHFLEDETIQDSLIHTEDRETATKRMMYYAKQYNVTAEVPIHLMVSGADQNIILSTYEMDQMNLHRESFYQTICENSRKNGTGIYTSVYYFSGDHSEYVLSLPLYNDHTYVGNISAYLDSREWSSLFSAYQYDTILTDWKDNIIFCSNSSFLSERNANKYSLKDNKKITMIGDNRYKISVLPVTDHNIKIYTFIYMPNSSIYVGAGITSILVLGIALMLISQNVLTQLAEKTSQSVATLVREIRIIRKEDSDHVIDIHTGDEIEEIAQQINKLIRNKNELMTKNLDLIRINSYMEMQNLQAQVNPHFIYNTLDNIKYLINLNPNMAEEMIERFTRLLRYSINNTKKKVYLKEDMEYINQYILIQTTRFGARLRFHAAIGQECENDSIPKLLLQPLIENSIKYGFQKKMEIEIQIKGWHQDGYLYLTVWDDGGGVSQDELDMLKQMLLSEEINTEHNGLLNIHKRIVLEYGKESGVSISSIEDESFFVELKIWLGEEYV